MVYKKYIVRNGKTYGPYTYHSRRVNGKVISEYHGSESKFNYSKFFLWSFGILAGVFLIYFSFNLIGGDLVGKVILDQEEIVVENGLLDGVIKISLKEGELLPVNSKILIETESGNYEYVLVDLVSDDIMQGDFYLEGNSLGGSGDGFGIEGIEEIYPEVDFVLEVYEEASVDEDEGVVEEDSETEETEEDSGESIEIVGEEVENVVEEIIDEIIEESVDGEKEVEKEKKVKDEKKEEVVSESIESSESSEGSVASVITGNVARFFTGMFDFVGSFVLTGEVSSKVVDEVFGKVSKENSFNYVLSEGETAKIKSGSVSTGDDGDVEISVEGENVIITTDYLEEVDSGFGEDYLGDVEKVLEINLGDLEIPADEGEINIRLVYEDKEILEIQKDLNEESVEEIVNETIVDEVVNESVVEAEKIVLSEVEKNILLENFGNVTIETEKAEIVNGRLVVKYVLGKYWVEFSYEYSGQENIDESTMEKDRVRWLKDLAKVLSEEEPEVESVSGLEKSYGVE